MVYKMLCIDLVNKCSVLYGTTPKWPLNWYEVILDDENGMLSEVLGPLACF